MCAYFLEREREIAEETVSLKAELSTFLFYLTPSGFENKKKIRATVF